jgi:hypothetical protein
LCCRFERPGYLRGLGGGGGEGANGPRVTMPPTDMMTMLATLIYRNTFGTMDTDSFRRR